MNPAFRKKNNPKRNNKNNSNPNENKTNFRNQDLIMYEKKKHLSNPTIYYLARFLMGNEVQIVTHTEKVEGVFKSFDAYCVQLSKVIIFDGNDNVIKEMLEMKEISLNDINIIKKINSNGKIVSESVLLDQEIANKKLASLKSGIGENKNLVPYFNEDDHKLGDDEDLSTTMVDESGWFPEDMLKVNKEKFQVKSTFNESMEQYTTQIDQSDPNLREKIEKAERLAKEIENDSASRKIQNIEDDDSRDEESRFSAVNATPSQAILSSTATVKPLESASPPPNNQSTTGNSSSSSVKLNPNAPEFRPRAVRSEETLIYHTEQQQQHHHHQQQQLHQQLMSLSMSGAPGQSLSSHLQQFAQQSQLGQHHTGLPHQYHHQQQHPQQQQYAPHPQQPQHIGQTQLVVSMANPMGMDPGSVVALSQQQQQQQIYNRLALQQFQPQSLPPSAVAQVGQHPAATRFSYMPVSYMPGHQPYQLLLQTGAAAGPGDPNVDFHQQQQQHHQHQHHQQQQQMTLSAAPIYPSAAIVSQAQLQQHHQQLIQCNPHIVQPHHLQPQSQPPPPQHPSFHSHYYHNAGSTAGHGQYMIPIPNSQSAPQPQQQHNQPPSFSSQLLLNTSNVGAAVASPAATPQTPSHQQQQQQLQQNGASLQAYIPNGPRPGL